MAWSTAVAGLRAHRQSLLVCGLILSLAAAVATEAMPSSKPDGLTPDRPAALPKLDAHAADTALPAPEWQSIALSRPLFALDRRPLPIDATPDSSMPRLSGTIRFANTALAIFDMPAPGGDAGAPAKSMVLGIGAEVAGWTIQTVTDEHVLLTKAGQIRSLDLAFSKTVAPQAKAGSAAIRVLHGKRTNVFFQP